MAYAVGDHVVLRDIHDDVAYFQWPVTVVEDADRGLLVSQVPGAIGRVPKGYPTDFALLLQQLESGQPFDGSLLGMCPPVGAPPAVLPI